MSKGSKSPRHETVFNTGVTDKKLLIVIHAVASAISDTMSLVLSVLHALSGCDSTS